ncbi:adenylyl-sulfate kinase [Actinokineospora enzanensis]|uniref:adenylyl-sulfate kinase n=1 Tax=Actinokineospora enzanensis TaxID=155975 RepID=UPI00037577A1|nr:adenylyl-sulfate kinase [Actinokineospora enzanensis]
MTERTDVPARPSAAPGRVVLLTGLSGSGKTTLAAAVVTALVRSGRRGEVLDGDRLRGRFWPELGLTPVDRRANLARAGDLAVLLARHGVDVVLAMIAPEAAARARLRAACAEHGAFYEVHLDPGVEVCRARDVKGLYARQAAGEITGLTGVDARYDVPAHPDLRLDTGAADVGSCARRVLDLLA